MLREASAADWPQVTAFFLTTPLQSGISFILDRRPDFGALPALRGEFRTFLVYDGRRLAGTATALWHAARGGARTLRVGEVADLRVAEWARGGRVTALLLRALHEVFVAERVDWILALIGRHNRDAIATTAGRIGLPRLEALEYYASVHFIAARVPQWLAARTPHVRPAEVRDATVLEDIGAAQYAGAWFAPERPPPWPDPTGRHRAWLAFEANGRPSGALMAWDGAAVRRVRIMRYRAADLPLRIAVGIAARLGLANPLPAPGEVFGIWATRWVAVERGGAPTLRALLDAALRAAAAAGQSVLQVNLRSRDPLLHALPPYPRSVYWSTLYGCRCDGRAPDAASAGAHYHADLALV